MDAFASFACLAHLTQLQIDLFDLDLEEYLNRQLPPFPLVRQLRLSSIRLDGSDPTTVTFCRTISAIFPSMEALSLGFVKMVKSLLF